MTKYELAIATADFLESNPDKYAFQRVYAPKSPNAQGCVLGHMGRLAGFNGVQVGIVAREILGMSEMEFYARMDRIADRWRSSAKQAADALRTLSKEDFKTKPRSSYYDFMTQREKYWNEYVRLMDNV